MKRQSKTQSVCVFGLGYIGLPMACILSKVGYRVHGVDNDPSVIKRIKNGEVLDFEPNFGMYFQKAMEKNIFSVSDKAVSADIYLIAVPTRIDKNNQSDISCVFNVIEQLKPCLIPDALVIIESTCPVGTTQKIANQLQIICPKIKVAYCPERAFPSNLFHELINNHRIIGGVDNQSAKSAYDFYKSFVKGELIKTDATTAELVKLAENTYRDVNIAFANELSMIADQWNLDINEVISFANQHPRVNILKPGPGVGGHCIAIDPWFLVASAPSLAKLTVAARTVNLNKVDWVVQKVQRAIQKKQAKVVACFGQTYKANVADRSVSPALKIIEALEKEVEVLRFDPFYHPTESYASLARAEIVIGLVAHDKFRNIPKKLLTNKMILDFAGVFE